jgi:uncharacterized protein YcaQ
VESHVVRISRDELRRRLIAWTGLVGRETGDLAQVVSRLGAVQIDPMQVVAPAHLWTLSLRRGVTPLAALDRALAGGQLIEGYCHARCLVHRDAAAALVHGWQRRDNSEALRRYGVQDAAAEVLARAATGLPFSARDLEGSHRVSGFWDAEDVRHTKATSVAIDVLWAAGRLAVVGRQGGQKLYQLMEQHLPESARLKLTLSNEEALLAAVQHSLRTYGLLTPDLAWGWGALARDRRRWQQMAVGEGWVMPVELREDPSQRFWAVPEFLEGPAPVPRRRLLLAPLDNVLWHRPRLEAVFGFRYRWQAYTPQRSRTGGAYNMPVLEGSRFWGEADARWTGDRLEVGLRPLETGRLVPPAVEAAARHAARLALALRRRRG